MTAVLLVAVAHGLDLLTFLLALAQSGIGIEDEYNLLMRQAFEVGGLPLVAALKTAGTMALACIAHMRRWALIPAAGAGIIGASVNLMAISIIK